MRACFARKLWLGRLTSDMIFTAIFECGQKRAYGVKMIGWWGMKETVAHGIVGSSRLQNTAMSIGCHFRAYQIERLDDAGQPDECVDRDVSFLQEYANNQEATAVTKLERSYLWASDRVMLNTEGFFDFAAGD